MAITKADIKAAIKQRSGAKKKGTYVGFAALKGKIAARGKVRNPGAVAAMIGRKKYGAKGFAALAKARSGG